MPDNKIRKYKTWWLWLVLALVYVLLKFVLNVTFLPPDILHGLLVALIEVLVLGLFYEFITKGDLIQEFAEEVGKSIALKKEIIDSFALETKGKFLYNIIEAVIGEEKGTALYKNMVEPYVLNGKESFRGSYNYYIDFAELEEDIIMTDEKISLSKNHYYMVTQHFEYKKFIDFADPTKKDFSIGFAFEDKTLDCWFREAQCIFREVLRLNDEDKNTFMNFTEDKKINILNKVLKFCIEIDDIKLSTKIVMQNDRFSLLASYGKIKELKRKKGISKFKVVLEMPQAKNYNRFSVFISEPTFNPRIDFCFDKKSMQNVTPITFFAGNEPCAPNYLEYISNKIKVEVGEKWIFPRSGVVFVWDNLVKLPLVSHGVSSASQADAMKAPGEVENIIKGGL